jgi:hypothetical protein
MFQLENHPFNLADFLSCAVLGWKTLYRRVSASSALLDYSKNTKKVISPVPQYEQDDEPF